MARSIADTNNGVQLRAWWLHRMLYSPHPLQEKLTLFWHNHFATSNAKVQNARFMLGQYELMRQLRPRQLRRSAPRDVERPGHADLAGRPRQQEGQPQRELRPRADGAVQPRHRQLHGEGRPRGRPLLHRLGDPGDRRRLQRRTSTTTARRPSSARRATGRATTSSASAWSRSPRPASSSASCTASSSARRCRRRRSCSSRWPSSSARAATTSAPW